jgi:hypothetical protein
MKTFKQHSKEKKHKEEGSGIVPAPIHFKHFEPIDIGTGKIPAAIHFKHVHDKKKEKLEEAKKIDPIMKWMGDRSDNTHLSSKKSDSAFHKEISNKLSSSNNYTPEHAKAIAKYTGTDSGPLNNALIKGKSVKKHEAHAKSLDSAIDNNRIQHDVHVYSGTSFNPMHHMDEKGRLHSPAYISATHARSVAAGYAQHGGKSYGMRHIVHIHLKAGDPATHVSHLSDYDDEHETIIKRGTTLQHHGHEDHYSPNDEAWYRIHHMSIAKDK